MRRKKAYEIGLEMKDIKMATAMLLTGTFCQRIEIGDKGLSIVDNHSKNIKSDAASMTLALINSKDTYKSNIYRLKENILSKLPFILV